jgi:hypothetical protein
VQKDIFNPSRIYEFTVYAKEIINGTES